MLIARFGMDGVIDIPELKSLNVVCYNMLIPVRFSSYTHDHVSPNLDIFRNVNHLIMEVILSQCEQNIYIDTICMIAEWCGYFVCRIKTGHPFLVGVSARRRGRWQSHLSKMTCQRPSLMAETSTKIWMTGLNPNYNTTCPNSALNFRKCRRNDTVYYSDGIAWFTADYVCVRHHPMLWTLVNNCRHHIWRKIMRPFDTTTSPFLHNFSIYTYYVYTVRSIEVFTYIHKFIYTSSHHRVQIMYTWKKPIGHTTK